jgi:hypothetical protein
MFDERPAQAAQSVVDKIRSIPDVDADLQMTSTARQAAILGDMWQLAATQAEAD